MMRRSAANLVVLHGALAALLTIPDQARGWDTDMVVGDPLLVGEHVSVAVDQLTGKTCIAFHDDDNDDLWLAREVGAGGNCGPNGAFLCEVVEEGGDTGTFSSIAVNTTAAGTQILISYHAGNALKYADIMVPAPGGLGYHETYTISSPGGVLGLDIGLHTSLQLDSQQRPHIAYQNILSLGDDALMYASWVGDGSGNCGEDAVSGDWQCETVDSGEGIGQYASLVISPIDVAYIAYYDGGNKVPKYMHQTGTGYWLGGSIERYGKDTGRYMSLYLVGNYELHLAYYNATDDTLEYAHQTNGGNCGLSLWRCSDIEDIGSLVSDVAIARDGAGYPIIAYTDTSDGSQLRIARPGDAVAGDPLNCGPDLEWSCTTVDAGGEEIWAAVGLQLARRPSGDMVIAYNQATTFLGSLQTAYERGWPIFSDGFELGDLSRWSSVVP